MSEPGKKRSRSEIQSRIEVESYDSGSDVSLKLEKLFKNKKTKLTRNQREQKKQINKHDLDADIAVKCRFCLKTECRLDGISKHVKKFHNDFYDAKAGRNTFTAKEG